MLALAASLVATGCGPGAPRTPLHTAVHDGNYSAVRHHIAARSNLNSKDKAGWTALHLAVMRGDLPMVRLLAEAGADPGVAGPDSRTPLQVARANRQTAIAQYLQSRPEPAAAKAAQEKGGRSLIDGGLGVSGVLDAQ
jgi:ankyrin repeat protein